MRSELKDKLAALALLMLARKCGKATTLTDGIDMSQPCEDTWDFVDFVNDELEPGQEYGVQVVVPQSLLNKLELCYTAPQKDESYRAYEVNAIIVKKSQERQ